MNANTVILWMIIVCVAFMLFVILAKPLKYILRFLIQAVVGVLGVWMTNMLMAGAGVAVGVNFITVVVMGLLGLPGFVALYIAAAIL